MVCILCLNDTENSFGLFDEKGISLNVPKIISQHFWFEPKENDNFLKDICQKCWEFVRNFHDFYVIIQKNHNIITNIESRSLYEEKPCVKQCINEFTNQNESLVNVCPDESYHIKSELENAIIYEENSDLIFSIPDEKFHLPIKTKSLRRSNRNKTANIETESENLEISNLDSEFSKIKRKLKTNCKQKVIENYKEEKVREKRVCLTDEQIARIKTLNCNNCSEKIVSFSELKKHMDEVHGEDGFAICCDKKYYKRYKFVNHLQVHLNPEEFRCPHCDKRLSSKKYIKLHIKNMHTETGKIKKYKCNQCEKAFAQKAYLERHKLGHIPDSEKHFACEICGNRFSTPALLRVHTLNVHEGRNSGICDLCGKKYKNPADLKRHRLEHMGIHEPKVQCEICGDWLSNKYKLKRHMLKHTTSDVEHRCDVCNKVSANLLALRSHMRLHITTRKFQCNVCGKGFRRSLNLKEHMTTHTGEALYSCPCCSRTFTHHSNLHHHRKKMHPKEFEQDRKLKYLKIESFNKLFSIKNIEKYDENQSQNSLGRAEITNNPIM